MQNEVRKSNFELLRIVAMILIIFHHFYVHGIFDLSTDSNVIKMMVVSFLGSFGKCASLIFILITGYFMIEKKSNPKRIIRLIFQFLIYNIIILVILLLTGQNLGIKDCLKLLLSIFWENWFVITYIQLLILSPFINKMLKSISKKETIKLILISTSCFFLIPTFVPGSDWIISNLGIFVITYIIGAYIKMYEWQPRKKHMWLITIISLFSIIAFDILNIKSGYKLMEVGFDFTYTNSIFMLVLAIAIFILFKPLKIQSKIINKISKSTLGIYLLHDNFYMRDLVWNGIFSNNMIINSNAFLIMYFSKIACVFILFLIADKVLMIIFGKLISLLSDIVVEKGTALFRRGALK